MQLPHLGFTNRSRPLKARIGYAAVLDRWATRLLAAAAPKGASEPRDIKFPDPLICLHCDARTAAESAAGAAVAGRLRQNPENGLASLSEICLPHLRLLAGALGDNPTATKSPAKP